MYYPSSENKGADQLRGYREADLRLCFRICRLLVFPWGGSYGCTLIFKKYSLFVFRNLNTVTYLGSGRRNWECFKDCCCSDVLGQIRSVEAQLVSLFSHLKNIRITYPCNEYPLRSLFYIVTLGYAGVYLFFLFFVQNIDCGYSLEQPLRGSSNVYPLSMF